MGGRPLRVFSASTLDDDSQTPLWPASSRGSFSVGACEPSGSREVAPCPAHHRGQSTRAAQQSNAADRPGGPSAEPRSSTTTLGHLRHRSALARRPRPEAAPVPSLRSGTAPPNIISSSIHGRRLIASRCAAHYCGSGELCGFVPVAREGGRRGEDGVGVDWARETAPSSVRTEGCQREDGCWLVAIVPHVPVPHWAPAAARNLVAGSREPHAPAWPTLLHAPSSTCMRGTSRDRRCFFP